MPLIVLLCVLLLFYVCFEFYASQTSKSKLDLPEAVSRVNREKGIYVDVRSSEKYLKSSISGAKSIQEFEAAQNKKKLLKRYESRPIILYTDQKGPSCKEAYQFFKKEGYQCIYILSGGYEKWIAEDYPVIQKEQPKRSH